MFLVRTLDADERSLWLAGGSGMELEPVSFDDGLRRLISHRVAGSDAATRDDGCRGDDVFAGLSLQAPFAGTKILCVGRNYRPHAEELGNPIPSEPLWFSKPPSALLQPGGTVILPANVGRIDYEGEMAIVIGRRCRRLSQREAFEVVAGITVALDVTARDLQKKDGQWTRAKGYDTFLPLGPCIVPFDRSWLEARLMTSVNDRVVQDDRTSSLIFSIPILLEHLTACMTLEPGDIILTGTPAGVGPLAPGDRVSVTLDGAQTLTLTVTTAAERPA